MSILQGNGKVPCWMECYFGAYLPESKGRVQCRESGGGGFMHAWKKEEEVISGAEHIGGTHPHAELWKGGGKGVALYFRKPTWERDLH